METDLGYNSKENPMGGSEMKTVFVGTNSKYIHTALGVRYIQENCRRNGLDTALVEVSVNEPVLSVLARLTEAEPDAIGFEVHIWNRSYVLELAELVRKVLPGCVVFAGGPEVLFHPARTLAACPALDYVVCGEGDVLVPAFLNELERFVKRQPGLTRTGVVQAFEAPAGFAFRRQDGSVAAPAAPVVVEDLDVLPFPYPDLDDVVRQHKIVYYESSRGCPFHCAYCLSGLSRMVRCRSVPLVLDDLDRMMAAGVPLVKFVDRTYNLDESHYLPIWEHLAAARTDTTFHFEIKGDLLDRRVVDFLKTVPPGRFQLEIGVQSTNPDVLDAIGRKDNWRKLRDNVAELLAAGNMHIHMDLIAGLPLEGMDSFARSFNEVHALHPQALQLGFLKVLPGTVMEGRKEQDGLVFMDHEPYEILSTNYIGYPELRFLKRMDEVFDLTANSGRFPFTLRYLEREGGDVFVRVGDYTADPRGVGLACVVGTSTFHAFGLDELQGVILDGMCIARDYVTNSIDDVIVNEDVLQITVGSYFELGVEHLTSRESTERLILAEFELRELHLSVRRLGESCCNTATHQTKQEGRK